MRVGFRRSDWRSQDSASQLCVYPQLCATYWKCPFACYNIRQLGRPGESRGQLLGKAQGQLLAILSILLYFPCLIFILISESRIKIFLLLFYLCFSVWPSMCTFTRALCVCMHVHLLRARAHPGYQLDLEDLCCSRLTFDEPPDLATPNNSYSQDYHTFPLHAFNDKTYRTYVTFIWRKVRTILKS